MRDGSVRNRYDSAGARIATGTIRPEEINQVFLRALQLRLLGKCSAKRGRNEGSIDTHVTLLRQVGFDPLLRITRQIEKMQISWDSLLFPPSSTSSRRAIPFPPAGNSANPSTEGLPLS